MREWNGREEREMEVEEKKMQEAEGKDEEGEQRKGCWRRYNWRESEEGEGPNKVDWGLFKYSVLKKGGGVQCYAPCLRTLFLSLRRPFPSFFLSFPFFFPSLNNVRSFLHSILTY